MAQAQPLLLAFDSSGAWCSVALMRGDWQLACAHEHMARGQAEALVPMLGAALAAHGLSWRELDALAVGVGPGNFTGIRIAVATARGLALALRVPAYGVSAFEAVLAASGIDDDAERLVTLPAPRALAYAGRFVGLRNVGQMQMLDPLQVLPEQVPAAGVLGHRAAEIAARADTPSRIVALDQVARHIGRIALGRLRAGHVPSRPAPLYIRPADASPPREAAVPILP